MIQISRLFQLSAVLGICFFSACAESPSVANNQAPKTPVTNEVMMYLHNGTDTTGTIVAFDGDTFELKTKTGVQKVERKLYQGMVLNIPEEKKFAEKAATDPGLYMTGSKFVFDLRNSIKAGLVEPKSQCKLKNFPILHFAVTRDLRMKDQVLLLSSGCKDLDDAVLKAVNTVTIPKYPDISFDFYPLNYFYEPPGFIQKSKSEKPAAKS